MLDIQNMKDHRNITIQRAGVKNVFLPLQILEKNGNYQTVLGEISLCADLSKDFKGTHMSRFMETLNKWSKEKISSNELQTILSETNKKLNSTRSRINIKFKYFIEKKAPVSRTKGMLDYICNFEGIIHEGKFNFILGIEVPVKIVCPCSKEISDYGAHNQRAVVRAKIEYPSDKFIWIEELIKIIEKNGSFEIFPVLKRSDEKYITEKAYENPKFVEDVVRDIVEELRKNKDIHWFEVECDSQESIHNHNAFAYQRETNDR